MWGKPFNLQGHEGKAGIVGDVLKQYLTHGLVVSRFALRPDTVVGGSSGGCSLQRIYPTSQRQKDDVCRNVSMTLRHLRNEFSVAG